MGEEKRGGARDEWKATEKMRERTRARSVDFSNGKPLRPNGDCRVTASSLITKFLSSTRCARARTTRVWFFHLYVIRRSRARSRALYLFFTLTVDGGLMDLTAESRKLDESSRTKRQPRKTGREGRPGYKRDLWGVEARWKEERRMSVEFANEAS